MLKNKKVTRKNRKTFCSDVNSARMSGAEQAIKLCEKHCVPSEYMLNKNTRMNHVRSIIFREM